MRRQRGFTLMEILIAMALTAIVTTSVLAIVRTQLLSFEMNDQLVRTQQNARAGMDLVETIVRRACGGISTGLVQVYTPNVSSSTGLPCLRFYDGAAINASSFTSSDKKLPDAVEVIYATGTMTALTAHTLNTTAPSITVIDASSFSTGDFVLLTDQNYANPALFKVTSVSGNVLSLGPLSVAPTTLPIVSDYNAKTLTSGTPVFKAATYSFFVAPSDASPSMYAGMLMVDPAGVTSNNHKDYGVSVQPAVEGVIDFQVAVGNDLNGDGVIVDWVGDTWGEGLQDPASLPWNSSSTLTKYRQVRLSLLLDTLNKYAGSPLTPWTTNPFEDRPSISYPTTVAGANPRYRSMRMIVAPRAWNLSE